MKLWLIRHGLTRLGEEKRYQGALDEPLSERGRAELRRAEFNPPRVYVSPMCRARETAEILFPEVEQIVIPDLREMDFGDFEGRGCNGEDRAVFSQRVLRAAEALLRADEEELVIVAHGGTQMALLERWGRPEREYYRWQTACGCGWELDWNGERLHVQRELNFLK